MKRKLLLGISFFFLLACFCITLLIVKFELAGHFQPVIIFSGVFLILFSVLVLIEYQLRLMEKKK